MVLLNYKGLFKSRMIDFLVALDKLVVCAFHGASNSMDEFPLSHADFIEGVSSLVR